MSPGQLDRSSSGRTISFWMRLDLIAKLERMAKHRGVKRNRLLTELVEAAEED